MTYISASKQYFATIFVALAIFLIFSYILAMLLGLWLFFFTPEGLILSQASIRSLPFDLPGISFSIPISINVGTLFMFLWWIYVACFVAAYNYGERFHVVLDGLYKRSVSGLSKNFLLVMPLITSVLLTAVLIIHSFQESMGCPTGSAPTVGSPLEDFLLLTYAPIVEELGFRIIPLGLFLLFYLPAIKRESILPLSGTERLKTIFLAVLLPEKAKKKLGLETGISVFEWSLIVLFAVFFGFAHWLSPSWEVGKITTTTLSGLVFGWTYLKYGAYAPILLHWFFNYYFKAYDLASQSFFEIELVFFFVFMVTLCVAFLGWILAAYMAISRLVKAAEGS